MANANHYSVRARRAPYVCYLDTGHARPCHYTGVVLRSIWPWTRARGNNRDYPDNPYAVPIRDMVNVGLTQSMGFVA